MKKKSFILITTVFTTIFPLFTSCNSDEVTPGTDPIKERKENQTTGELYERNISSIGYLAPAAEPEDIAIDLGIGVKFAAFNVGASNPTESGDVFHWAGIAPNTVTDFSRDDYHMIFNPSNKKDQYNPKYNGGLYYIQKYCFDLCGAILDCEPGQTLLKSDDAAYVLWGEKWRMPTQEDFETLYDNIDFSGNNASKCLTAKWDEKTLTVTNKETKVSLTFPLSYKKDASVVRTNYWTNQLSESKSIYAIAAKISEQNLDFHDEERCCPCFVRPIYVQTDNGED